MALLVYKVDGNTRLVMNDTDQTDSIIEALVRMGHLIELTHEDPNHVCDTRSDDEITEAMKLISFTGI